MSDGTILVVEDNPIIRKMIRVALASEGYTVLEAPDGQTARAQLAAHTPDLILQDLLLPDLDGFELVRQLRAMPAGASVPILALSGFLSRLEQARSLQVGFTDYLFKPIEPSVLVRTVGAYLRPERTAPSQPGAGRRILVVDDDPVQLKLLTVHLEHLGFVTVSARDGREALDQARAAPPAAVISDVLMPRLDGFRLTLALRQEPGLVGIPIILTSAVYTEADDQALARSVGADAFALRSADQRQAIDALLTCLERHPVPTAETAELPLEQYTHRVIRQLEHQVRLSSNLSQRLAILRAELSILGRILETIDRSPAPATILGELLYRCLDAAGISRGAAYLLDDKGRLTPRAWVGYPESLQARLADYFGYLPLLQRVLAQAEPVEIGLSLPPVPGAAGLLHATGTRSILLAPLTWGEQALGVLEIASIDRELDDDWLGFGRGVGSQIGQALGLARIFAQLAASEQRYHDLVDGLPAIVWEAEAGCGRFTFVSHGAEALLGYPVERWLEVPDFFRQHVVHAEDRQRYAAAIAAAWDLVLEYRVVAADGRVLTLQDRLHVVPAASGAVRQLRGVMTDVTDRRELEAQQTKLQLAREIHQRLFPVPPALPGFDLGGLSVPAEATGGDYFDFLPMSDDGLGVVVGDVSGHGFGPALLMAEARAYLRAFAQTSGDVAEVLARLNGTLLSTHAGEHFITLLLAKLEPRTHALVYASAGHPNGYILTATGAVRATLPSTGLPLGIDAGAIFPAGGPLVLEPGELLLLLTDGVLEARSPDGHQFGTQRALDIVRIYRHDDARQIVANLYHAVAAFCQGGPQADDITAVVVKAND